MSTLHALLIGVDHYFEYPLPNGTYYPKLGGCVRDINKIYNFLTTRLALLPANINKLTATVGPDQPLEPASQWPTYANMVAALQQLTARVQAGDQVYLQYSGHGGRTATLFPKLKGAAALDEALVPLDIGKPGDSQARYLRDVELYHLLGALKDKGVRLTVVFDCCHSGGITRGDSRARRRGIGRPDPSPPPADSLVAPLEQLAAEWATPGGQTRKLAAVNSWRFETQGYTLFTACRANESAFEFPFDGGESNGALTYWLLDTLHNGGPDLTWQMVADRVVAKVHGQFEQQTPTLQGEGDYRVFGAERLQSHYAVAVLAVEPKGRGLQLNAGEVQGIKPGAQFAVYPAGQPDFTDPAQQLATVEITEVEAVTAWGKILQPRKSKRIEVGAQAVLSRAADVQLQHGVALVVGEAAERAALEQALAQAGKGFVVLADREIKPDFQVAINPAQPDEYELWDGAGASLPNLRPAIKRNDPDAAHKLVQRLVHLAKYRNVLALDLPDATLRSKLRVEWDAKPVSRPGDRVRLVITNAQTPGAENDPARILNITILALAADWSITQLYPASATPFEPLDPGQSIQFEFEAMLADGYTENRDILKIFATRNTTQFRWLELPALDQPPKPRRVTRSGSGDPLERLLALVNGDKTSTRAFKIISAPQDQGWTVAQVEWLVQG